MRPNVPKHPLETGDNPPATTAPEPTSERSDPTARERCPPSAAGDPAKTQHQPSPSRHPPRRRLRRETPPRRMDPALTPIKAQAQSPTTRMGRARRSVGEPSRPAFLGEFIRRPGSPGQSEAGFSEAENSFTFEGKSNRKENYTN